MDVPDPDALRQMQVDPALSECFSISISGAHLELNGVGVIYGSKETTTPVFCALEQRRGGMLPSKVMVAIPWALRAINPTGRDIAGDTYYAVWAARHMLNDLYMTHRDLAQLDGFTLILIDTPESRQSFVKVLTADAAHRTEQLKTSLATIFVKTQSLGIHTVNSITVLQVKREGSTLIGMIRQRAMRMTIPQSRSAASAQGASLWAALEVGSFYAYTMEPVFCPFPNVPDVPSEVMAVTIMEAITSAQRALFV